MGGYGAMRLALTHPERFAGAASFSSAVDLAGEFFKNRRNHEFSRIFGEMWISGIRSFHVAEEKHTGAV